MSCTDPAVVPKALDLADETAPVTATLSARWFELYKSRYVKLKAAH